MILLQHNTPSPWHGILVGLLLCSIPSTLLGEDSGIEEPEGMGTVNIQRQMRDLYHGWSTREGIWSPGEQDAVTAAGKGTGSDVKDFKVLLSSGLIPLDTGRKGLQMWDRHQANLVKIQVAESMAAEEERPELISRARKVRNRLEVLQSRERSLFMKRVRKAIGEDRPSLVGRASGGGAIPLPPAP